MTQDQNELSELYMKYSGKFYAAAYSILKNRENAEDAVSEMFLKLAENAGTFAALSEEKRLAYAKTTLRNISLNMLKKGGSGGTPDALSDDLPDGSLSVEEKALGKFSRDALAEFIGGLSGNLRQALYLRVHYGLPTARIAEILGISETAARKRLSDAQKKIREFLEVNGND